MNSRCRPFSPSVLLSLLLGMLLCACGGGKPEAYLSSARDYLARNEASAAAIEAKNALQQNPDLPEGRYLLGVSLLRGGDAAGGEAELRKALALGYAQELVAPMLAQSLLMQRRYKKLSDEFAQTELSQAAAQASLKTILASAYLVQGETGPADVAIVAALRADPNHAPALLVQARGKAAQGEFDKAIASVEDVIARTPANHDAWKLKGDLLWDGKGQAEEALAAYRKSVELKPAFAEGQLEVLATLLRLGRVDEASKALEPLRKVAGNHPRVLYLEALLAYDKQDLKLAQKVSQQLLVAAPADARYLQLAGDIELRLNALTEAEAHLFKALQIAPRAVLARRLLVDTYLRMGRVAKALETLQPVLDGNKLDLATLLLAGDVFRRSGDLKRAEGYFAQAARQDPKSARARTSLALTHLAAGSADSGLAELRDVADSSSDATADLALIGAHVLRQEFDQALAAIDVLEKKQPGKPVAANLRGRALMGRRDMAAARANFERALAIDPGYFPAVDGLAAVDLAENKPQAARQRFEALLVKEPKNVQAWVALANLRARTEGSKSEVTELLTRAVAADPTDKTPRLLLIDFHLRNKDAALAMAAAEDGVAALPGNAEMQDALGRVQLASGDLHRAIATFNQLASRQAHVPGPRMHLAEAQLAAKDKAGAAESLRKALMLQPDLLQAQQKLIALALDGKDFRTALGIARTVQEQRPTDAQGYLFEGEIAAVQKRWGDAAEAYQRGLKQTPSPDLAKRAHAALGAAGNAAGRDRLAATWLKEHRNDVVFRLYLGDISAARGDYVTAEKMYASVTNLQAGNAIAFNNLAWVSRKLKKNGARAFAEKAVALAPEQPAFMDTLAMLLADEKNYAKALEWQTKALALQPQNGLFRLNLARIQILDDKKDLARKELDALSRLGDKFRGQAEVARLSKSL